MASFADAIAGIESGGKYDLLGPVTKSGDRAYGKYQVMGSNIPQWTQEIIGQPLTPQQFLASPEAQDAVFNGKFGQYVNKYGPEGAAQAWFGGPGAVGQVNRKDQLGTSVGSYGQRFMTALTPSGQLQPAQTTSNFPAGMFQPQPTSPPGGLLANGTSLQSIFGGYGLPQQQQQAMPQPQQIGGLLPQQFAQQQFRRPPDLSGLAPLLANAPAAVRGFVLRG